METVFLRAQPVGIFHLVISPVLALPGCLQILLQNHQMTKTLHVKAFPPVRQDPEKSRQTPSSPLSAVETKRRTSRTSWTWTRTMAPAAAGAGAPASPGVSPTHPAMWATGLNASPRSFTPTPASSAESSERSR